jgi:hypothetical protein
MAAAISFRSNRQSLRQAPDLKSRESCIDYLGKAARRSEIYKMLNGAVAIEIADRQFVAAADSPVSRTLQKRARTDPFGFRRQRARAATGSGTSSPKNKKIRDFPNE